MPKINVVIGRQNWELVRNRIGEILIDEINNQYEITSHDKELKVAISVEGAAPIDKVELPSITVCTAMGTYDNKNQGNVDGLYTYHVDVYTAAKTTPTIYGPAASAFHCQRLVGLCRYILEDPIYKTLGFQAPYISRVMVTQFEVANTTKDDAINTSMIRLVVTVKVNEPNKLIIPNLIEGYDTVVKIGESNSGYVWVGNTNIYPG